MKLVMTLLVRDEEDILTSHLQYHLARGVDFFVITDNLSLDNTRDIIEKFVNLGVAHYIYEKEDTYDQSKWVTQMARLAYTRYNADWIINSDADEFWWPKKGTLKSILEEISKEYFGVSVKRYNFVPCIEVNRPFYDRMIFKEIHSKNPLGKPLPPKVSHRGYREVVVAQGNHIVTGDYFGTILYDCDIEIFHFPMRTYSQFENKISKGGKAYENNKNLPKESGYTWRELYKLYMKGKLREYYNQFVLDENQIEDEIKKRALITDKRLKKYMHRNIPIK